MSATLTFKKRISKLRSAGLLKDLTPSVLKKYAQELCEADEFPDDFSVLEVLDSLYYSDQAKGYIRSQNDCYLRHDWRFYQETDDVVAEIAQMIGGKPLFKQLRYLPNTNQTNGNSGKIATIEVERDDAEILGMDVSGLDDIVGLFNERLTELGDTRQFVGLETDGEWHAYILLADEVYKTLAKFDALPFDRIP